MQRNIYQHSASDDGWEYESSRFVRGDEYDSQPPRPRQVYRRRWPRVVAGSLVALAAASAGTYRYLLTDHAKEVVTPKLRDACHQIHPHFGAAAVDQVVTCSPYKDAKSGKTVRKAFTIKLIPHSAVKVADGFAVGAQLTYADGMPGRIFGAGDDFSLKDFDNVLTNGDEYARSYCATDFGAASAYVLAHTGEFASKAVDDKTLGTAEDWYSYFPVTRLPGKEGTPNLRLYQSDGQSLPTTDITSKLGQCSQA